MKLAVMFTFPLVLLISTQCSNSENNTRKELLPVQTITSKVVKLDPIEAAQNPSKHAWDLFLYVNHPAIDYRKGRGIPDSTKSIGDSGIVNWETWKHAGTEVFLDDGRIPPPWEDFSLDPYLNKKGKILERSTAGLIADLKTKKIKNNLESIQSFTDHFRVQFNPDDGLIGRGGETRMNKSTFDFILKNELYYQQGIMKFRADYLQSQVNKRKPMTFNNDAIEVKGMWREFSAQDLSQNIDKKFYTATDENGRKFGLTSLHIITKELPNWFWCSFRQKDGPVPAVPSVDDYGQPTQIKGTFWENYELSGTQIAFTDSRGMPIKLSDPLVEDGFEQSSCISCHSTAVIGPKGGMLLFTQVDARDGQITGTPKIEWFTDPQKNELVQTDFVFSIPFRAKERPKP